MQLSEALNHPGGDVHLQTPIEFAIYRHISTVLGKLDQRDFALIDSIRSLILENRDNVCYLLYFKIVDRECEVITLQSISKSG